MACRRAHLPSLGLHAQADLVEGNGLKAGGPDRRVRFHVEIHLVGRRKAEVDADLSKETGRKDIVFFPSLFDEPIYFCLEAKRLNAVVSGQRRSLADEYVKEGMQRFVDGKYSRHVRHGGMLGYVLDGDSDRAIANVSNCIGLHQAALRMEAPAELLRSRIRPDDPHTRETRHRRPSEAIVFCLHHLFVAGAG